MVAHGNGSILLWGYISLEGREAAGTGQKMNTHTFKHLKYYEKFCYITVGELWVTIFNIMFKTGGLMQKTW